MILDKLEELNTVHAFAGGGQCSLADRQHLALFQDFLRADASQTNIHAKRLEALLSCVCR